MNQEISPIELIDKFLPYLKSRRNEFESLELWADRNGIKTSQQLRKTSVDIMIAEGLVEYELTLDDYVRITYKGIQVIDSYGSYTVFLEEKEAEENTERRRENFHKWMPNILSGIAIIVTIVFGILTYVDSEKDKDKTDLLEKRIQVIEKQLKAKEKGPISQPPSSHIH